ncbi:hypothetical protein [Pseudomonas sp. BGI-2]|uniref:hypothetical protein n=1 Tax=Pseudomonas sp. BGI-2 TaxID=2528211 RepID=UPI0010336FB5|nr:hypothetical protein [Pseudomonas sp. BGI-2]TBN49187.1 hypothetical protein EYC95_06510 [Pseudomonas sp. BGI-2]
MPLPSSITDLSTTAGSNSPAGSESPSLIDDYLRTYASYIALLRDQNSTTPQTIASATLTDIGGATTNVIIISGTVTITGLGTAAAGVRRSVRFSGILVLTHNATSLVLPGAANITTAAGDCAEFRSLGSGNWVCTSFNAASGDYCRTNILGTVSQASGVPTGAIIETITNSNGIAMKLANGVMFCLWQTTGFSLAANGFANFGPYSLPASFTSSATVLAAGSALPGTNYDFYGITAINVSTTNSFTVAMRNGATAQTASASIIFAGRWYV